jgi:hypothetical protein
LWAFTPIGDVVDAAATYTVVACLELRDLFVSIRRRDLLETGSPVAGASRPYAAGPPINASMMDGGSGALT